MTDVLVGGHGPNRTWQEDDYQRLARMRARVVVVLWTGMPDEGGTHHQRAEYEEIERRCPGVRYVLRVGPPRRCSFAEWLRYARAALAEVPEQIVREGRLTVQVLNEPNLAAEGGWSPEDYAAFLRAVCANWSGPELLSAPISLGADGWRDWWARFVVACGGRVPTARVAVHAYGATVADACAAFAGLSVPVDVTETGTLDLPPGPARGAWLLDAARRFAAAGFASAAVFIVGGDPGHPPAWDANYVVTDDEADAIGAANGVVGAPVVVVPPSPAPQEPTMPAGRLQLGIAHRQGNDLPAARQTVAGLIAAHHRAGSRTAILDCYQGRRIQGVFSQTPVDVSSLDRLAEMARAFDGEGIALVAMVNPFGADPEGEGDDHSAAALTIANATGKPTWLAVDREDGYAGFWRIPYYDDEMRRQGIPEPPPFFPASASADRWSRYTARLTAKLSGIPWHLVPDPQQIGREYPASDTPADVWFLLQAYWTIYELDWRTMLARYLSAQALAGYGHPILPGIPGAARSVDIQAALAWLPDHGFDRCWVWDMGALADYDLDLLATVADPTPEPLVPAAIAQPAQPPQPTPLDQRVIAARDAIYDAGGRLDAAAKQLIGGTHADELLADIAGGLAQAAQNAAIAHKVMRHEEAA